jgi:chemotaxis protein MotB
MPDEKAPIYVIKKKVSGGGHHGGAWKVAYADFVTAMMALFMVMWLMNTAQDVKDAIAGYFKDPTGTGRQVGSSQAGSGEAMQLNKEDLEKLKDKLEQYMKQVPEFVEMKDQVQMTVTGEGLRIELLETEKGMFFESGSSRPSQMGADFLDKLAKEIGKLPNQVVMEGHTDAKPFKTENGYSNWELSSDRANAARRMMESSGLRPGQITQVRGFADQRLRKPEEPEDASNRRISVIIQYQAPSNQNKSLAEKAADAKEAKEKEAKEKAKESGKAAQKEAPHDAKASPAGGGAAKDAHKSDAPAQKNDHPPKNGGKH